MTDINILFGIPTPRDNIPEVIKEQKARNWTVDRIIPKFLTEYYAYQEIRNYFLDNKKYTHLVLAADDIVVEPRNVKFLQEDLLQYDFPILSGVINVYHEDALYGNVTPYDNVPNPTWDRDFDWYKMRELRDMETKIIPVGFAGFGLTAIRRDVVEKIDFDSDGDYNKRTTHTSGSMDVIFCWRARLMHIPIFCDTRLFMKHLRLAGKMRVGKEKSELWFWPKNKEPKKIPMSNPDVDGIVVESNYKV